MYCPVCHCEYVAGVTFCADCQAALVENRPGGAPGAEAAEGSAADSHWVLLWSAGDPRRQEDLCAVLEDEKIPARGSLEGGLLNLAAYDAYDVYVPAALVPRAKEVLRQFAASEEEWQRSGGAAALELPAEEEVPAELDVPEPTGQWHPDDATSEVWSGANTDLASMIAASLRENMIRFRADPDDADLESVPPGSAPRDAGPHKLFVLPQDDARARGIVRQIVDAVAP
jgi:hypothetical protein